MSNMNWNKSQTKDHRHKQIEAQLNAIPLLFTYCRLNEIGEFAFISQSRGAEETGSWSTNLQIDLIMLRRVLNRGGHS
ncbi:hypothetical protein PGTUg99_010015 [Puccinia graminis f. sp. tritici]|uniref:Uncharacterized protein n=1 Tax=Puccinia graminis f. sp. tritici TaxID=56615 RepID=A0A5B0NJ52_PUCGR|nr:hypothetical protein PGTUg99_010015 [Puccinia graminis f. sp. tritici]